MTITHLVRGTVAAACAATLALAMPASAQEISRAETLLFQTNHLANVRAPATLTYTFHQAGSGEPGFDDQVRLVLASGKQAVTMTFLTGARQYTAPPVENPEGNPVLLGFLEHDIAEMQRLTGGSSAYFRKRIRLALAEGAQVQPRHFMFGGEGVDGNEIVIVPYKNDPMHARFEPYVGKRYIFVVSSQVPGGVYQVRAVAAGASGTTPLQDETLTLASVSNGAG